MTEEKWTEEEKSKRLTIAMNYIVKRIKEEKLNKENQLVKVE